MRGVFGQLPEGLNESGSVQKRKWITLFLEFPPFLRVIHVPGGQRASRSHRALALQAQHGWQIDFPAKKLWFDSNPSSEFNYGGRGQRNSASSACPELCNVVSKTYIVIAYPRPPIVKLWILDTMTIGMALFTLCIETWRCQ